MVCRTMKASTYFYWLNSCSSHQISIRQRKTSCRCLIRRTILIKMYEHELWIILAQMHASSTRTVCQQKKKHIMRTKMGQQIEFNTIRIPDGRITWNYLIFQWDHEEYAAIFFVSRFTIESGLSIMPLLCAWALFFAVWVTLLYFPCGMLVFAYITFCAHFFPIGNFPRNISLLFRYYPWICCKLWFNQSE